MDQATDRGRIQMEKGNLPGKPELLLIKHWKATALPFLDNTYYLVGSWHCVRFIILGFTTSIP